jgi:long-subunit acyl-CoA synthetase (AMP-forming)
VQGALMERLAMFREHPYRMVSYLPLCHGAEQLLTTVGTLATGGKVYFCDDLTQIRDYLVEVRPTVFLGVPRVWEKFEAALSARMAEATGWRGRLAAWARRVEQDAFDEQVRTGTPQQGVQRRLANRLVHDKIKRALGLDALLIAITGSAPISPSTLGFFSSIGIGILEAYGLSETHGVCTITLPERPRLGTVGPALPGCEIRIAPDGEVQLRGRIMTQGYLHMPEETAALYTDDGWLCTGDLGALDADGHLRITGRKKDLLITAGGKNVAPVELEALLQQIVGVGIPVVVGDRKPYLSALLTLDVEAIPELQRRLAMPDADLATLASSDALRTYLEGEIERVCNQNVARYQTIKRFRVLPHTFSNDTGELTPTMKLKRNVITERYADEIEAIYAAGALV